MAVIRYKLAGGRSVWNERQRMKLNIIFTERGVTFTAVGARRHLKCVGPFKLIKNIGQKSVITFLFLILIKHTTETSIIL